MNTFFPQPPVDHADQTLLTAGHFQDYFDRLVDTLNRMTYRFDQFGIGISHVYNNLLSAKNRLKWQLTDMQQASAAGIKTNGQALHQMMEMVDTAFYALLEQNIVLKESQKSSVVQALATERSTSASITHGSNLLLDVMTKIHQKFSYQQHFINGVARQLQSAHDIDIAKLSQQYANIEKVLASIKEDNCVVHEDRVAQLKEKNDQLRQENKDLKRRLRAAEEELEKLKKKQKK